MAKSREGLVGHMRLYSTPLGQLARLNLALLLLYHWDMRHTP